MVVKEHNGQRGVWRENEELGVPACGIHTESADKPRQRERDRGRERDAQTKPYRAPASSVVGWSSHSTTLSTLSWSANTGPAFATKRRKLTDVVWIDSGSFVRGAPDALVPTVGTDEPEPVPVLPVLVLVLPPVGPVLVPAPALAPAAAPSDWPAPPETPVPACAPYLPAGCDEGTSASSTRM